MEPAAGWPALPVYSTSPLSTTAMLHREALMFVSWNNNSPLSPPVPPAPYTLHPLSAASPTCTLALSFFSPPPPTSSSMLVSGRCCVIRECVPAEALFTKAHSEWTMSLGENAGYCEGLKWGDPTTPLLSDCRCGFPTPSASPTSLRPSLPLLFLPKLKVSLLSLHVKSVLFFLVKFSF